MLSFYKRAKMPFNFIFYLFLPSLTLSVI
jgi:hypothetical protein